MSAPSRNRFERPVWRLGIAAAAIGLGVALSAYFFPKGFRQLPTPANFGTPRIDQVPYLAVFETQNPTDAHVPHRWRPFAVARNYYPDCPRDYFWRESADQARIHMQRALWEDDPQDAARTVVEEQGRIFDRIAIATAHPQRPWAAALKSMEQVTIEKGSRLMVSFEARAPRDKPIQPIYIQSSQAPPFAAVTDKVANQKWQTFEWQFAPAEHTSTGTIAINLASDDVPLDIGLWRITIDGKPPHSQYDADNPPVTYVELAVNNIGFRDDDFQVEKPPGTRRIVVLGDSCTFGVGVHRRDLMPAQLERILNERGGPLKYECLNFALPGYSTFDERVLYEEIATKYHADVVLVVMCSNDYIPIADEVRLSGDPAAHHEYFLRVGLKGCLEELHNLEKAAQADGARLAIAIFGVNDLPDWDNLEKAVFGEFQGTQVPVMSTRPGLIERGWLNEQVYAHERDWHPNNLAQQAAAEDIAKFLADHGLLASEPEASP